MNQIDVREKNMSIYEKEIVSSVGRALESSRGHGFESRTISFVIFG